MTSSAALPRLAADDVNQVLSAAHKGDSDFGYQVHRNTSSGSHVLVTCAPDKFWQSMPGDAVRSAIGRHLTRYARALAEAGFGTAIWMHRDRPGVLIVAADQPTVDVLAPSICDYLTARNPEVHS